MKIRLLFGILTLLLFTHLTAADVIVENPDEMLGIKISANYPDYSFYVCQFSKNFDKSKANQPLDAKSRTYNGIQLEKFSLKKLTRFSPQTPYFQKGVANTSKTFWLAAVKKEVEEKGSAALEENIVNLILLNINKYEINGDGIYMELMRHSTGMRNQPKFIVNEVTGLDQNGLKINSFDTNDFDITKAQDIDKDDSTIRAQFCAGILIAFGITFSVIQIIRRK